MASRALGLLVMCSGALGQITVTDTRTTVSESATTTEGTPTGTYLTYTSQMTNLGTLSDTDSTTISSNSTVSQSKVSTTDTRTFLTGGSTSTASGNFSSTTVTSATATVTNTRPCNNYPEFCNRKYSNITEVSCHNSPFVTANNLAANQQYDVTYQLNDGVRFIQAQIQWPTNATEPHFCHTSCDILDAGPITDWLGTVKDWVASHPYDVVTILLGNGNYSVPSIYYPYIESTGILDYVYTPPLVPMTLNDWPTLAEMILTGKRVVMFLDYMANQTEYPWLLDEFSQMWETPFDPTDNNFPCDVQRPPNLADADAQNRLYLINHNLNIELSLLGTSLLVPARDELNVTNAVNGTGSVGLAGENCLNQWGRAPNFLNVDYYNRGSYAGSVFEAAAQFNNVTYSRSCCGTTSAASRLGFDGLSTQTLLSMAAVAVALLAM
ncbi:putative Secreted protein [Seiridium cardinale]|uniref:Secreted protein n=1 Tax=Seiridium cardinale TaxID=138064 RepID=A0ABR2Y787_9PEZI